MRGRRTPSSLRLAAVNRRGKRVGPAAEAVGREPLPHRVPAAVGGSDSSGSSADST